MFLGGSTRYFTDDYLPENNNVGFHGHYDRVGHLDTNLMRQYGLRDWIIKYSDGKADPVLVERWINIPYSRGMIHFFHPGLIKRASPLPSFMCQGDASSGSVFACEPIAKTALDLGIVTIGILSAVPIVDSCEVGFVDQVMCFSMASLPE